MADARTVKQKLRKLLRVVDFDVETQRSITAQLERELNTSLSQHKPLIKEEIDAFLTEQQDEEDDAGSDSEPEPARPPPAKKQKAASGGAALPPPPGDCVVPLSAVRFATVRQYGGKSMVDVREFYEKDNSLKPGAKGLALQPEGWAVLVQQAGALTGALEAGDDAFRVELGASTKRASISTFKGRHSVDLREYYEKEGEMRPGKKGIALQAEEWGKLCTAAAQLSQQLQQSGGGSGAAPSAGPSGARKAAGSAGPSSGATANPAAAGASGAVAGGAAGAFGSGVELSSTRRADVSTFKNVVYVNIREYYEKDGQKLPGSKGISLPREQFAALNAHAAELDAAVKQHNTAYELQLSAKRKATVSCFKKTYLVNLREYYEKDGQQLPGKKGISLSEDQWAKLLAGLPGLAAALDQA
ncbi:RNA polymerase II transcriptional coactivator [Chlorella vulgaris]